MITGGMTQYLAKVQGMPETTMKTLKRIIRNFAWSGENKPTIAMAHMTNGTQSGGKKVLDIYARNEAIQLTWAQAYLRMDENRPTWALVADEIFRNDVPGEPTSLQNNPNARINQFLQTWHSRINKKKNNNPNNADPPNIPNDLREMIKTAKKHGVRLEAIDPAPEVRANLPAIRNTQTKASEKPDTLSDKHGKYLRNTHRIRTLQDVIDLTKTTPNNHKRNKKCKCTKCKNIRQTTNSGCKHPNKCIERAAKLLETINEKWDPSSLHPPEYKTHPKPDEIRSSYNPTTKETTHPEPIQKRNIRERMLPRLHKPKPSPTADNETSDPHTLGAKGHLPRGYIEDTLRFFKQFAQKVSRGIHAEFFYNVSSTLIKV